MRALKIYVASSWRNEEQPSIVEALRKEGHEVYDFKNPPNGAGFGWSEVAKVGENWKEWTLPQYLEALGTDRANEGFKSDMGALMECDVCVLVFPSGVSAAMEFGWACGAGKRTIVYGMPREADLMVKMGEYYAINLDHLLLIVLMIANGNEMRDKEIKEWLKKQ